VQIENIEGTFVFEEAKRISPFYVKYSFYLANGRTLPFKAGQYLDLVFHNNGIQEKRSYSIASPPNNSLIDFVIKDIKNGMASSKLNGLKKGDVISFDGPFGQMSISNWQNKSYVFIATGSGIAPFRSMLPEIEANMKSGENRVFLLLGISVKEDAPFLDEFLNSSLKHKDFKLYICYGIKSDKAQEAWEFNVDLEDKLVQILEITRPDKILISSNPTLINKTRLILAERGFSSNDILCDI
jgi:ferredoxin-NADP reductase